MMKVKKGYWSPLRNPIVAFVAFLPPLRLEWAYKLKTLELLFIGGRQNHVYNIGKKLVGRVAMASSLLQSAMHMAVHSQNK